MSGADQSRAVNLEAYRRLKGSLGRTYGRGRFVAICAGRVAADAATFDDLRSRLAQMGEDPSNSLIVQADVDYPEEVVIFSRTGLHEGPFRAA